MNRFFFILAAVVCMVALAEITLGCKHVPSCDVIYMVAHAGGTGTALVMNETKLDTEKRTVIRDIMKEVRECTPEVGQTLEAAWTPIAQAHTDLLIQEGKIDAATGVVIMAGFKTVMVGVNLLEARYPVIRANRDLLNASITGFTDGFLAKFEVECENCTDGCTDRTVGAERLGVDRSVVVEVRRASVRNGLK